MTLNFSAGFSTKEEGKLNTHHHMVLTNLKLGCVINFQNYFTLSKTRVSHFLTSSNIKRNEQSTIQLLRRFTILATVH